MTTTFLRTVRKSDGEERFYIGGCRVTRNTWYSLESGYQPKSCFQTIDAGTHWRHYHCRNL